MDQPCDPSCHPINYILALQAGNSRVRQQAKQLEGRESLRVPKGNTFSSWRQDTYSLFSSDKDKSASFA